MDVQSPSMPDIAALSQNLTLEEKISLLSGKDLWHTHPIDRLKIPSLKVSDGPNGARGGVFQGGISSACFPASVSLAASFNKPLVRRIGKALAEETRAKGATVLLGPTVCPHRDPRGGRNFESFSEDPFLAGQLASEYIHGLQQEGVGATIKHFVANESETKRLTIDARVSQRALREIYLKPFEIAIKKADPWALMTSYNIVNGTHADMNRFLLTKVLREEWDFKGLAMSDWGGTNSTTESLNAGLDLEMPGPGIWRKLDKVTAAIKNDELNEKTLDQRVAKVLELLHRTNKFNDPIIPDEQAIDLSEHRQLIREAGADGIVLLKNENNVLPVDTTKVKSIALIGLAKEFLGHGGGSASVNAHHKITAYQALTEALGSEVELKYAEGARIPRNLRPLQDQVTTNGSPGFAVKVYSPDASEPTVTVGLKANFHPLEKPNMKSVVMIGTFTPEESGDHYLSFATLGNTSISIDGNTVFHQEGPGADVMAFLFGTAPEERKQHSFNAGQSYEVKIEASAFSSTDFPVLAFPMIGFNLGFALQREFEEDLYTPAVELAKTSDVAIVFTGHTPVWESEGCDRTDIDLPVDGVLDRLVEGCAKANKNVVVVNSTGSPVAMPWINNVAAVLQTWFPGQEAGHAMADVLLGKASPGGKLPVTFPKRIEDAPTFGDFPFSEKLEDLHVNYKEDIYIGYRYYCNKPDNVLFPFGFGLSYTTFTFSAATLSSKQIEAADTIEVSVTVTNSGNKAGSEVLQVYIGPEDGVGELQRPKKILAGWSKSTLNPGENGSVAISMVARDSMQYWDEDRYKWVVPAGNYVVYVATSASDQDVIDKFTVEVLAEATFDP